MTAGVRLDLRRHERESLERKRRGDPDPRVRRRAAILLMSGEDWPVADICQAVGVTRATVTNTRTRWRRRRLAGLGDLPRSGRPPVADGEYLAGLLRAVGTAPGDLGYVFGVWTTGRLAAHLERTQGKTLCADRVRARLHAMGYVWARPKHTLLGRRDEGEEGTFANTLPPSFEAIERRVRARFRTLAHVQCRAGHTRRGRPVTLPRMLKDFRRVA